MDELLELAIAFTTPRAKFVKPKQRAVSLLKANNNLMLDFHFVKAMGRDCDYGPLEPFEWDALKKKPDPKTKGDSWQVILVPLASEVIELFEAFSDFLSVSKLAAWHRPKGWSGWFTACYVCIPKGAIAPEKIVMSQANAPLQAYLKSLDQFDGAYENKAEVPHEC